MGLAARLFWHPMQPPTLLYRRATPCQEAELREVRARAAAAEAAAPAAAEAAADAAADAAAEAGAAAQRLRGELARRDAALADAHAQAARVRACTVLPGAGRRPCACALGGHLFCGMTLYYWALAISHRPLTSATVTAQSVLLR